MDLSKGSLPVLMVVTLCVVAFGGGGAMFSLNNAIETNAKSVKAGDKRTMEMFRIELQEVNRDLSGQIGVVSRQVEALVHTIKTTTGRVVGKTPEGFNRRDCGDNNAKIADNIRRHAANRVTAERHLVGLSEREKIVAIAAADIANEAASLGVSDSDCYDLQGFKSRRWTVSVTRN